MTFYPMTPKSIGFICYPGWMMYGPSLKKVDLGLLELLIGNKMLQTDLPTNQSTDRPTDMCKAICPLFF